MNLHEKSPNSFKVHLHGSCLEILDPILPLVFKNTMSYCHVKVSWLHWLFNAVGEIKPQLTFSLFLWLIHFWPLLPPSSDSILFGSHVFLSRMQTGMGLSVWRVFNTNYPSIIFPNWIRFCSSVKTASIPELGLLTSCMCTYAIFCIWRYWNPLFNPISSF